MKCEVCEGLAIFSPLQRGVTLLFIRVPEEESRAVHFHSRSHTPPQCG